MITKEQKELLESRAIDKSILDELTMVRAIVFPECDLCNFENITTDAFKSVHHNIVDVFLNFDYRHHVGIGLLIYVDGVGLEAILMIDKNYVNVTDRYFKNASLGFRQCNDGFVPESISIGYLSLP